MAGKSTKAAQRKKRAEHIVQRTMMSTKEQFWPLVFAINLLKPAPMEEAYALSSDGEHLFYQPEKVNEDFDKGGYAEMKHQLMHVVLHGLLGHFDQDMTYSDRKLVWVVMDRMVCHFEQEFGLLSGTKSWNAPLDEYLGNWYDLGCYFYAKNNRLVRKRVLADKACVASDEHMLWHPKESKNGEGKESKQEGKVSENWGQARRMLYLSTEGADPKTLPVRLAELMKNSCGYDRGAGDGVELVQMAKNQPHSYRELLLQFMRARESMAEQPDSVDPMLYQYGMELYGDVPILEPAETEEILQLHTICVAIDTSASCEEEIASFFLRETYQLFRDMRQISRDGEVYLFQCDDEIQMEKHFTSLEDALLEENRNMEMYGWGGTSFTPVFERIGELQTEGKVIDCLIYLTDSYGDCPKEKPSYPVFFILPQALTDEYGDINYNVDLPDWIEMVGLGMEE